MWMYTLLPRILNMSLTAGIVIILVLIARLLLKKAPKIFSYVLWAVVLFRLVCPISFSSELALIGFFHAPATAANDSPYSSITYIPGDIVHTEYPRVDLPLPGIGEAINQNLPQGEEQLAADPLEWPMAAATSLWLLGITVMLAYSAVTLVKLRRKLVGAVRLRDNIYLADHISTPFVIGVFRPKIYLPSTLPEQEQSYIILHEQTHIRRLDHIVKMIAFLALAVHWFNPLVWVAFVCAVKDMEMSCDEGVLKEMGGGIKGAYSTSLLSLAMGRRFISGSPLAFGEGNIKGRIKNVMNFKKPAAWVIAVSTVVVAALSVGFAANSSGSKDIGNSTQAPGVTTTRIALYDYSGDAGKPLGKALLRYGSEEEYGIPDTVAMEIFYPEGTVKLSLYCRPITGNSVLLRSVDFTIENSNEKNKPDIRNPDIFVWDAATDFPHGFSGTIWAEAIGAGGEKFPADISKASSISDDLEAVQSISTAAVYSTSYDTVKITYLSGIKGGKSADEFETTVSNVVAYIDSTIRNSQPAEQEENLNKNYINQYTIQLSNDIGGYSCGLYYDTLYNKAYIVRDGGLSQTNTDFARYIDSLLENTDIKISIEDSEAVSLFKKYGWTLDYQISAMNSKLNNITVLTGFNPNAYYFAYNNVLSKDIGLDMSGYSKSAYIEVEIYRIRESMPQEFYPMQNCRGIVVKDGTKIIGAFISAGRHSAFNACSLKGNSFEKVTGQTLDQWLAKMIRGDSIDERLSKLEPEQLIEEYFMALNEKDAQTAKACISKKTLLGNLTSNMSNDELFNEGYGLLLTDSDLNNLKLAKLQKAELIDVPDKNTKTFRITVDLQYNKVISTGSGEQSWDCIMVYESPQTGWKIYSFGH